MSTYSGKFPQSQAARSSRYSPEFHSIISTAPMYSGSPETQKFTALAHHFVEKNKNLTRRTTRALKSLGTRAIPAKKKASLEKKMTKALEKLIEDANIYGSWLTELEQEKEKSVPKSSRRATATMFQRTRTAKLKRDFKELMEEHEAALSM